jgi:hypothetical protein
MGKRQRKKLALFLLLQCSYLTVRSGFIQMQTKLSVTGCSSSCASFSDSANEKKIFYLGKWRKVGDKVRYDYAKGFRKLFRFPIVFISPEACAEIQLPKWWNNSGSWRKAPERERRATIIGNTICPTSDRPSWMK